MATWKPIIAGVDPTVEGKRAAAQAVALAKQSGARCHLVHAVRDPWVDVAQAEYPLNVEVLNQQLLDVADERMRSLLQDAVPPAVLRDLEFRMGSPAVVLDDVVEEYDAELLVLGGKHHSVLGRWLAGSTAHLMVRRVDVPVFIAAERTGPVRRVMAAVDLSSAARPTIAGAERMAALLNAQLIVLHVIEPLPIVDGVSLTISPEEVRQRSEEELERAIWPHISSKATERLVREGPAIETIAHIVSERDIDLLVVGSHGRGLVDRLLLGSATERLLSRLPTSMLVVPVSNAAREAARAKLRHERQAELQLAGGLLP